MSFRPISRPQISSRRVRFVSAMVIAVLLVLTAAAIIIPYSANSYIDTIAQKWRVQSTYLERKGAYVAEIYRHLGFGGFIHDFKNYVMRQEPALREKIGHNLNALETALDGLEKIIEDGETKNKAQDRKALADIRRTIDSYIHNLEIADEAARLKWPPTQTDAIVRVDDTPAIEGIETLRRTWREHEDEAQLNFEAIVSDATTRISLFLVFVPFLALSGFAVIWFVRRLTREIVQRQRAETEVRRGEILVNSIGHLGNGVSVFDRDLKLVAFNKSFFDLLELPENLATPGRSLADFFRYNAERGEYGEGDIEDQVRERMELAYQFQPHKLERTRPDGTVIEIHGIPLPDKSGLVTTYTDAGRPRPHWRRRSVNCGPPSTV